MMMTKETEMKYIGKILNNGQHYEAISDEANDIINIFYKNIKNGDIECWSLQKAKIQQALGKDILAKTKNYWSELSKYSTKKLESMISLQTFPWDFWADVVVPIKNGQQSDFEFEFQPREEVKQEVQKTYKIRFGVKLNNDDSQAGTFGGTEFFTSIEEAKKEVDKTFRSTIQEMFPDAKHDGLIMVSDLKCECGVNFVSATYEDGIELVGRIDGTFDGGEFNIEIIKA